MTQQEKEIYEYGLKCLKQDKERELLSRKAYLKVELLDALNEPMNYRAFKQIATELIDTLAEIERQKLN